MYHRAVEPQTYYISPKQSLLKFVGKGENSSDLPFSFI